MPYTDQHLAHLVRLRGFSCGYRRSRGAVLVVALILLLILTLIGITAARLQTAQEGMARNDDNHQLALQSAEAALRDGEGIIALHTDADFLANASGLYDLTTELNATAASIADTINWSSPGTQSMQYSGAALGNVPQSPQAPQIIIEHLPPVAGAGVQLNAPSYGVNPQWQVYRITAHAQGGDGSSSVTLQSIVSAMPPQ
ncbi:MAG TPA: PilX N-terminal domain-containing pilus assembly protein [Steroidobacteraceae bacterium]|nr:PilX N-terminal domain-containing pilus assembly protein [Steroidobacteraceae bacterium]